MTNSKVHALFQGRILWVEFLDKAVISEKDLEEVYSFADEKAKGKKYCVMFEAYGHYDITEEGMDYLINNPHNKNVLAKVYLVNSREAEMKTKLHLSMDKPDLVPQIFKTSKEGLDFLKDILEKNKN